jgi:hypothetical protein
MNLLIYSLPDACQSCSVDPFTSSIDLGLCNPSLAPEHLHSGVSAPQPEAPSYFASNEQNLRIQELRGDVSSLKKQVLVALGKSKHVADCDKQLQDATREVVRLAEREEYLLDLASRVSDDLACK